MIFDEMGGKPAGLFYTINGYIYGNLPGLYMKQGDKVRWYLLAWEMRSTCTLRTGTAKLSITRDAHTDVVELLPGSMKTVDMIADNLGTWMFHCHVDDHMEAGMMAVYTIYTPPARSCPVSFVDGEFWKTPEKFSLTVKNESRKPIESVNLTSEMFLAPQDLRPVYNGNWHSNDPIAPGEQRALQKAGISVASAQKVLGWVFFPNSVKYQDGSTWQPQSTGECFHVFWRDPQHPEQLALPPLQFEINSD